MKRQVSVAIGRTLVMSVFIWVLFFGGFVKAGSNSDKSSAATVSIGNTVSGTLSAVGEEAWYTFTTIDVNAFYSITASTTTAAKDMYLELLDAEGRSVGNIYFSSDESGSACYKLDRKTVYYVRVNMGDMEASGNYSFRIASITDDFEDTLQSAANMQVGKDIPGKFEAPEDKDYAMFTTPDIEQFYEVAITNKNLESGVELVLMDGDENVIDIQNAEAGATASITAKLQKNSKYYIGMSSIDTKAVGDYTVKVSYKTDNAGDKPEAAKALPFAITTGKIDAGKDEDYFVFTSLEEEAYYNFAVNNKGVPGEISVELLDENIASVESFTVSSGEQQNVVSKLEVNKKYYIHIASVDGNSTGEYSITVTPITDNGGDSIEKATTISLNGKIDGRIDTAKDVDYFQFVTLPSVDFYNFSLTNGTVTGGVTLELLDLNGKMVDSITAEQGENKQLFLKLPVNTLYYLYIAPATEGESGAYSFIVESVSDNAGNTADSATQIAFDQAAAGRFELEGDVDYLKFTTLESDSYYEVLFSNDTVEKPVTVSLLTAEGQAIHEMSVVKGAKDSKLLKLEANKTYYMAIQTTAATGVYSYKVTAIPDDVGDTMDKATAIAVDTPMAGKFEVKNDADYLKFTTLEGNYFYEIVLENETVEKEATLTLLSADGQTVKAVTVPKATSGSFVLKLASNTAYYLALTNVEATGSYSYKVVSVPDDGGDNMATATALELDKELSGSICIPDDVDYYVITTNQATTKYTVILANTATKKGDLTVKVMEVSGKVISTLVVANGKFGNQTITLAKNKKYYICISGQEETANYILKVAGKYTAPKNVKLANTKLALNVGKKATLKVSVEPVKAVIQTQTWTSSKTKVATVTKKGVVKAKKKGTATITCKMTFYGGKTKTVKCKVTVK